jgi:hypothetical protein
VVAEETPGAPRRPLRFAGMGPEDTELVPDPIAARLDASEEERLEAEEQARLDARLRRNWQDGFRMGIIESQNAAMDLIKEIVCSDTFTRPQKKVLVCMVHEFLTFLDDLSGERTD